MNADMIELDVLLTNDGVPVVFHDVDVRKLTNGKGKVSDLSFSELKKLDAGITFSNDFKHERIPSLKAVLDWLPAEMLLNIEIKPEAVSGSRAGGIEEKVIQLIEQMNLENRVLLSSFNYTAVKRFNQINSEIKTGLLYEAGQSRGRGPSELIKEYEANFFHCSSRKMTKKWRMELNDHKIPYLVYTINRKWAMKRWLKHGAAGIFSDRPDLLKEVYLNNLR